MFSTGESMTGAAYAQIIMCCNASQPWGAMQVHLSLVTWHQEVFEQVWSMLMSAQGEVSFRMQDVVETHLLQDIAARSENFFQAASVVQDLRGVLARTYIQVKALRKEVRTFSTLPPPPPPPDPPRFPYKLFQASNQRS